MKSELSGVVGGSVWRLSSTTMTSRSLHVVASAVYLPGDSLRLGTPRAEAREGLHEKRVI
jgi:hypothetical protein